jgi:hypothetical protein
MSENPIRIKLRQGSQGEWNQAEDLTDTKGNLAAGEFGLIIDSNTDETEFKLKGCLGVFPNPTPISNCPIVFMAEVKEDIIDEELEALDPLREKYYISTKPIIYEKNIELDSNTIITWNSVFDKWETNNSAVLLNELPITTGSVFYNEETNSFSVGEVIFASEIDGGFYGGTDE